MSTLLSIFCRFYYKLIMLFRIYLLSFLLHFTSSRVNKNLKISCGLDDVTRDSVAMKFFVKIESTGKDCKVECIPGRCCTEQGEELDCGVIKLFGGCLQNIPAGESRTVRFAAPILDRYERRGYCVVHVNSKLKGHPLYRDTVTIPFDTGNPSDVTPCAGVDQDALHDCQPVDCHTYYNDHKPYFSKRLKRCLEAPFCSDDDIYDENLNRCVKRITEDDIKEIQSIGNRKMRRKIKSVNNTIDKDDLDIAQSVIENYNANTWPIKFLDYMRTPKILICVICVQCAFVIFLVYSIKERCLCVPRKKKEVVNTFFNYRHDGTVTTPLLSSPNTMTTCQFQTDSSSNVDRKIKFYKACQNKKAKACMSDDILSRCLKRRDWIAHTNTKSSDIIQEKEVIEKPSCKAEHSAGTVTKDILPDQMSSEQQVQCVEYEPQNIYTKYVTELQRTHSLTENCVQANFSKDSIDEFLSERGLNQSNMNISSTGTSKNNLVAVLSLLSHKIGPFSEHGGSEDLELLHMTHPSAFSSDASDYDTKRVRESRSSL